MDVSRRTALDLANEIQIESRPPIVVLSVDVPDFALSHKKTSGFTSLSIGQTARSCSVKHNSSWLKGTVLSCPVAGVGI